MMHGLHQPPLASVPVTTPVLNTTRSQAIFGEAQSLMPGGVSSPVRAFKSVGGQPLVFNTGVVTGTDAKGG